MSNRNFARKKFCPNCGTDNKADSLFCKSCGNELEDMTGKCPYCAEKINPNAVKCKHCGEWLDKRKEIETKKEDHSAAIIFGYLFTILGGLIGLIFGIYLLTRNDESAKKHGILMLAINIIWIFIIIIWFISWIDSLYRDPYPYYYYY